MNSRAKTGLALVGLLVLALVPYRNVLPAPATLLPTFPHPWPGIERLDQYDQHMVIGTVISAADQLVRDPSGLLARDSQCYPTPRAWTFGEPMWGVASRAALPWAATRDPILSFNIALVLAGWIGGMAMFRLALYFTGNIPAAFIAGAAATLSALRIGEPAHPYTAADIWAPLVLLSLHRTIVRARIRDALALTLFLGLQMVESLYPLLATLLLATPLGIVTAWQHASSLRRWLPKILLATALTLGLAMLFFQPYLATKSMWGVLGGRVSVLAPPSSFLPGGVNFPGIVLTLLAIVGLADRLRSPRLLQGRDPRLALFAGGALCLWAATGPIQLPGTAVLLPSPIDLLTGIVPGLDAVRALSNLAMGVRTSFCLLAAYGAWRLFDATLFPVRTGLVAALTFGILLPHLWAPAGEASFGGPIGLGARYGRPPASDVELLHQLPAGAVLDLPLDPGVQLEASYHLFLLSFEPRPVAACYNSFRSPAKEQVANLAARLPDREAAGALHALGFRTAMAHRPWLTPERVAALETLPQIGSSQSLSLLRLPRPEIVTEDIRTLSPGGSREGPLRIAPGRQYLPFQVTNHGDSTFRQPGEIEPRTLNVSWAKRATRERREEVIKALSVIALEPGAATQLLLAVEVPREEGLWRVEVADATLPMHTLARRDVRVVPGARAAGTTP